MRFETGELRKTFQFEAAHLLPHLPENHKCRRLHGHSFKAEIVVAGEADRSTPVELVRTCANAIAGARFECLPGVGHIPSIEQPAELAALIEGFLKESHHG